MKKIDNLFDINDGDWNNGSADGNWSYFVDSGRIRKNKRVPVKPNTQYTLKCAPGYQIYIRQFASESGFEIGASTWRDSGYTFKTESTTTLVGVIVRRSSNSSINLVELSAANPIMVEGAFESYSLKETNNFAATLFQKNLLIIEPRLWPKGVRQQNQSIQVGDYRITYDGTFPKVEENKLYRLEMNANYKAGVFVFDKNNVCLLDTGWKYGSFDFAIPAGGVKIAINFAMSNDGAIDPNRILQSGLSVFKKTPEKNKPAKMYRGKNFLTFPDGEWTRRPGTLNTTFTKSRLEWDNFQDYAGVQILLEDALLQGKTVTFGGKRHPDATIILFYKKPDGTNAYIGLGTGEMERTLFIPYGASECRFYVQNANGIRTKLWAEDLYLNIDSDKIYTPSKAQNKTALLFPKKNLIPDFNDPGWFNDSSVGSGPLTVDPENPYKAKLKVNLSAQGKLIWIPVEHGKTYTFSFKNITGLYRIYKRKVINHDNNLALAQSASVGAPTTYSFTVDADYQGYISIRLTQSVAGEYTFENLQLEEGISSTNFEPLKYGPKKPVRPIANMIDFKSLTPGYFVSDANGLNTGSGAGLAATDYMDFVEGKKYVVENMPNTFPLVLRFAYYDKNKTFISGTSHYSGVNAPKTLTAPTGARYMRTAVHPLDYSTARIYCIEDNTKDTLGLVRAPYQDIPIVTSRNVPVAKDGKIFAINQPVIVDGGIRVSEIGKESHVTKPIGVIDNVSGSLEFTYIPDNEQSYYKTNTVNRTYFSTNTGQNFRVWSWGGGANHIINFDFRSDVRVFFDFGTDLTKLEKGVPIKFRIEWSPTQFKLYVNDALRLTKDISTASNGNTFNGQVLTSPLYIGTNITETNAMTGIYKNITIKDRNGNVTLKF
ncbi:hypothetical protein CPT_Stahl43 [Bacillus phage Stahl]|uniref:Uncharacterized protein n=1 Tax=Bacillus phage Stahl TaxID=1610832 RepID=A0A0E3JQ54_9CAUD|nr:hypothetical protein CPT_Stahl43 [Bacillus phage Stahl]AKA61471.1 hypothetical protein CPT_Stahl43 [Bacillus phage Stahl]